MKLLPEHIEHIREAVEQEGIQINSLKEDLIDHLCCAVEEGLQYHKDFKTALKIALTELAPDGLAEIQNETIFLLNSNKIMIMKKFMYVTGLLSSITVALGFTLNLLRLPGAQEILTIGLLVFGLIFIPLFAFDQFKIDVKRERSEKYKLIFGSLSALVLSIAVSFKLLHLLGANELLVLGILLFSFGFLPFQFHTLYKKSIS